MDHPKLFPGETPDIKGFRALTGAIQQLLNIPLDGVVSINLNGFVDVIDALGGVWINVPYPIHDDAYPLEGGGYTVVNIKAGCQLLSGHVALEFARSRHQASDYQRMDRQQITLEAVARQVDPIALLGQMPTLLQIVKDNYWSTFQPSDIGRLARFATTIDVHHIQNYLFIPPTYPEYLGKAEITQIQEAVGKALARLAAVAPAPTPPSTRPGTRSPAPRPARPPRRARPDRLSTLILATAPNAAARRAPHGIIASMPDLDLTQFDVLTFDCYGTLIDWESGLLAALLGPCLRSRPPTRRSWRRSGRTRRRSRPARTCRIARSCGRRSGGSPPSTAPSRGRRARGVRRLRRDWPAFPDSRRARALTRDTGSG